MTKLYMSDLMTDLGMISDLAAKVTRYLAEELACADPMELMVLLGCHELLARKIVTYAKMKAGGAKKDEAAPRVVVVKQDAPTAPHVVVASSATLTNLNAQLTLAFQVWEARGLFTDKPLSVPIDDLGLTLLSVKASACGHFEVSAATIYAEPVYQVRNVADLVNALYRMDGRYWRVPIDGVIRALISYAESGKR